MSRFFSKQFKTARLVCLLALYILVSPTALHGFADPERLEKGQAVFKLCAGCHTIEEGGPNLVGPNLHGVFGRDIASMPNYEFSETLRSMQGVWDQSRLNRYIARPKLLAPGNNMAFGGLTSPHQRSDLIEWLKSNPEKFEISMPQADAMRGSELAAPCTACHSFGKDDGNYIGPNLWGIVGRPIASADNFDYSERLMRREGIWTPANLEIFFSERKQFDQGSHMAFRTLKRAKDRANIIAWLSTLKDDDETADR